MKASPKSCAMRTLSPCMVRTKRSMKPKRVYDMLSYVVEEPAADAGEKRMYKYPFIVSEAFKTEAECLVDPFFADFDPTVEATSIIVSDVISEEAKDSELVQDNPIKEDVKKEEDAGTGMYISYEGRNDMCEMGEEATTETTKEADDNPDTNGNKESNLYEIQDCDSVIISSERNEEAECKHEGKYAIFEKLLSFIQPATELNPVLAGYFENVLQALINTKKNDTLSYLFNNEEHTKNLLKHSYNQSISNLLGKMLKLEDTANDEFLDKKQDFIETIVSSIAGSELSLDAAKSCYKVLADLAQTGNWLEFLTSEPMITRICAQSVNEDEELASAALEYLAVLIRLKGEALNPSRASAIFSSYTPFQAIPMSTRISLPHTTVAFDTHEDSKHSQGCKHILTHCINYLRPLRDKLQSKAVQQLSTQFGQLVPVCGRIKLSIVGWLHALVRVGDVDVAKELGALGYPKALLELVQTHYMNSCLHSRVYHIFSDALSSKVDALIETVKPLTQL
eukprot:TRINITY_DN4281_c0_g3_i1.p1 TRINITY_DN4281_c0_g3~~TRINITY_DN4281_c0_g3_i1.p1  ORF type:complete len:509 (+),score=88.34 TRINITY_DN4281_c0_g3_i1:144-1670(+)